ncbi:replication-associated recombination protein A [Geobacter sp. DSM 9736]|uniref:replication-associated recombination protein A n=1 Tax=Geobacter sp. DSM 9736 TaxID=1277350 RepID=UPI000B5006BC|nr:replication-associated recombination protein A [Geobacter sp. DSM 9736]SNB46217.1 Recombination protein MgsA [Geobacter sp. DSM 9736]
MDLFDNRAAAERLREAPLAERMRPRTLEEYVGQEHLLGQGKLLRRLVESDQLTSLIFWGPPGSGKTTLARIIANATRAHFIFFSAILSGMKEIREVIKEAEDERKFRGRPTILFIDEIHRFNKSQQDAFLPHVERGTFTIIGATTENPSFEVIAPLLSRCKVLVLNPLTEEETASILSSALRDEERGLGSQRLAIAPEALTFIAGQAGGDARVALNTLETAARLATEGVITLESAREAVQKKPLLYDKGGEEHYNVISAFIKSMRGSDPDAALYWLARMLESGEDPLFILRRMIILASEDIGNADPRALQMAVAALQGFQMVGMPEGRIILGQAATYLATAPKSNASYVGIDEAIAEVRQSGAQPVPLHVRNAPTRLMKDLGYGKGYLYAHAYDTGYVAQDYLPDQLAGKKFYRPAGHGYEKTIKERMEYLKGKEEKK